MIKKNSEAQIFKFQLLIILKHSEESTRNDLVYDDISIYTCILSY